MNSVTACSDRMQNLGAEFAKLENHSLPNDYISIIRAIAPR